MSIKDKPSSLPEFVHADLKNLTSAQLQRRLEAYCAHEDAPSQQQLVQELLHELQVQQIELELQNRQLQESQRLLEEARDRYADLYNLAPVSYVTFDAAGCIQEINQTGTVLLGQERERLLGKPFGLWLSKDAEPIFFRHLQEACEGHEVVRVELQLSLLNSQNKDVRLETIASSHLINNKPACRSVIIDISQRKKAQWEIEHQAQQIRLITDAIPALIAYVDRHEHFQFANKAYAAWIKKPQDKVVGMKVEEAVGPLIFPYIAEYVRLALSGKQVSFEFTLEYPDNTEQDINAHYIPDVAEDGSVLGYFIINRDVTELRLHEALDKMHLLETAHVARINTMGEMVAELAHELNQPLAAITIYSDAVNRMLGKETPNIPEIQNALGEIRLQAGRAGEVIRRLREFVSKREIHNEQIQINILIKDVMNLISVEARWYETEVKLELGEAILPVMVDRILIEQVILNLTRNAIEAMCAIDQNKRRLTLKTSRGAHNEVILAVGDTGPGLTVAEIDKIFEPFYTTKVHGMGMGLAISRSIIKAHHGRLWAIPNEYGGTTFTFTLPYQSMKEDR